MSERITLEVSREHGALQLSINKVDEHGSGWGYRLAGPKFCGSSETLLTCVLGERDAAEIRGYLDELWPVGNVQGSDQEAE